MLACRPNGTLYIGVTSDVLKRVWEHKSAAVPEFSATYGLHRLVYVEFHDTMESAILREKQLRK
ncbi:GIY-YIG nuclease family protein [Caenispirillum salinarum]|uniref:GIY-YIG nuclease family protein n=1 Tax=Caenispirillum salinarum TaxID=859058 RepID=UPI002286D4B6|nr:GIY-YIG nuclease family protein [Caenispirillum salinarum]